MSAGAPGEDNPLRTGLRRVRRAPPCTIVIVGATGDLTRRKLLPALQALAADDLLDERTDVVGLARGSWTDEEFRAETRQALAKHDPARATGAPWAWLGPRLHYVSAEFDAPEGFARLAQELDRIESADATPRVRVFYLATPPSMFAPVARQLAAAGLLACAKEHRCRLVVEKPFGHALASARALNVALRDLVPERAIFRIDHYLGKETVQNLLVLRFANGMFEPLWNARHVDNVQITVSESIGIEGRGTYFEEAGIVRDMVQNHVFQLLALTAMEPPAAFEADTVRDEKVKVLRALRPVDAANVEDFCVRGQYTRGAPLGREVPAYREERDVAPDSRVETFVALRLFVDNWRWAGVPFFLRVGKALPKKVTEIAIHFRAAPHRLFPDPARDAGPSLAWMDMNVLAIRIQPDEGVSLRFLTKVPGPEMVTHPVSMEFRYGTSFGAAPPEAYERLLLDALLGDGTLFTRDDEVEASWSWIGPLRQAWEASPIAVPERYEAGTWGPPGADALVARSGRRWRRP